MAAVELERVVKSYDAKVTVIHGVDLQIQHGEFVVFVGPSGCGKSTLLRMVAGLEPITGGSIRIDGQVVNDLPPRHRDIAMVFQDYALYPHKTLYDNMAFGLRLRKTPEPEIERRVMDAARLLHIAHLLDRRPAALSGGQRQRVAIGRAIVRQPKVFLFDEPLSNLDAQLRHEMRTEIKKLHQRLGATIIYVTHDQVEAMTLADRIVVLSAGKIEQVGSPIELYEHPDNLFVAGFIGSPKMNFIEGEIVDASGAHATVRLASGAQLRALVDGSAAKPGDKVTLGVRPEHFHVGGDVNVINATVTFVESLGSATHAYCAFPGVEDALTCEFDGRTKVQTGQVLALSIPAEACYLFDGGGRAFKRLGGAA